MLKDISKVSLCFENKCPIISVPTPAEHIGHDCNNKVDIKKITAKISIIKC